MYPTSTVLLTALSHLYSPASTGYHKDWAVTTTAAPRITRYTSRYIARAYRYYLLEDAESQVHTQTPCLALMQAQGLLSR